MCDGKYTVCVYECYRAWMVVALGERCKARDDECVYASVWLRGGDGVVVGWCGAWL